MCRITGSVCRQRSSISLRLQARYLRRVAPGYRTEPARVSLSNEHAHVWFGNGKSPMIDRKPGATTPIVTCGVCHVSWTSYKAEAHWVCPSCKGKP
jgi:hypothetical protein